VDGLLYQRGRARQYHFTRLEEPISNESELSEEVPALSEILIDPAQSWRFTEERAISEVLIDTVRDHLSPKGNGILTLRLRGFTWKETQRDLSLGYREMESLKKI
jgi:hypothetical protein